MVHKLRRNFVLTTVFLFALCSIIICVAYSMYDDYGFYRDTYYELKWLSKQKNLKKNNRNLENQFSFEKEYYGYNPIYVLRLSTKGKVLEEFSIRKNGEGGIPTDIKRKLVRNSMSKWKGGSLVYLREVVAKDEILILATDCEDSYSGWYIKWSILLIFFSLLIIAEVSLFLSRFVTTPAKQALSFERRILSNSSHELKNPLTGMIINLAVLQKKYPQDEEINRAMKSATTLSDLVHKMLVLSRLEEAPELSEFEEFNLSSCVQESVDDYEPIAYSYEIGLHSEVEPNISCYGDGEQLRQILPLLLDNAIKYNNPGGSIQVRLRKERRNIILEVADTGIGIREEDLPHIFERFYVANEDYKQSSSGLGLSMVQAIGHLHKGKVTATSKLNQETTITVTLPVRKTYVSYWQMRKN